MQIHRQQLLPSLDKVLAVIQLGLLNGSSIKEAIIGLMNSGKGRFTTLERTFH
jgi:hypothetical protein